MKYLYEIGQIVIFIINFYLLIINCLYFLNIETEFP